MSELPPIFVINRAVDVTRKADAERNYQACNITPQFIEAVDGHGDPKLLAPYVDFLGDSFWGKPEIKPGAFACFMSHRNAWQRIVDQNLSAAIIAEDDSIPAIDFQSKWEMYDEAFEDIDLTFLNNRMSEWVGTGHDFQDTNQTINTRLKKADISDISHRAPGADGYFLTHQGAEILLEASLNEKVHCGVDWFMIACAWDSSKVKHSNVKTISELKKIWKHRGSKPKLVNAKITRNPWFSIDKAQISSINHSERVDINVFRNQIQN